MPIQRQSEQYSAFDTGTRWARDKESHDLPKGIAGLVNSMGPRVGAGMLNTREGGKHDAEPDGESWVSGPDIYNIPHEAWEKSYQDDERDIARMERRKGHRTAGWHYPEYDPRVDGYPEEDLDRPSAADFAEEDYYRERRDNEDYGYLRHLDRNDPSRNIPEDFIRREREARLRTLTAHLDSYRGGPAPRGGRHPFDRAAAARLAACQECGEELYPDEGWHHVNGFADEYDHDASPEPIDFDRDEYEMHRDPAEAYDELKYRQLRDEYRQGRRTAKDGKCTCWEGYERVPGTEPCADGSCRKKKSALRRLMAQMSYEDAMKYIDQTLAAGEPEDKSDYSTDYYDEGFDDEDFLHPYPGSGDGPHPGTLPRPGLNHREDDPEYIGPEFGGAQCDRCGAEHDEPFQVNDVVMGNDYKGKFCDDCITKQIPIWYPDSNRTTASLKQILAQMSYEDTMKYIDEQLAAGEHDNEQHIPHSGLTPRPPTQRERILQRQQAPYDPEEERRLQEEEDAFNAAGFHPDDNVFSDDVEDRPPTLRELFGYHTAAGEAAVDPAAQQQMVMPAAGGYQPGHRVGLPWRNDVVRGTVIGLDGDMAAVRWDDGQYSSEEPHNIQLL